jgi:hypothetical protein
VLDVAVDALCTVATITNSLQYGSATRMHAHMLPPPSILCLRPKLLVHQTDSTSPYSVFAIMIPTALFTALNRGSIEPSTEATALISDASRGDFLKMSRGVAIILLVICE